MTGPVIPIASESSGSNFNFRLHPPSIFTSTSTLAAQFPPWSIALIMSLSSASSTLLRTVARQQVPTSRAAVTSCQRRGVSDAKSSFESPFASANERGSTLKIPNFSKYKSNSSPRSNQVFSYFMAGSLGLATAVGAKATVQGRFFLTFDTAEIGIARAFN